MAKAITSLSLLLLSFISVCNLGLAHSGGTLLANINYACSQVDCRIIQKGCTCSLPDNLFNHASIAMNLYYKAKGRNQWNCYFGNSGLIVTTDPSYGSCIYE